MTEPRKITDTTRIFRRRSVLLDADGDAWQFLNDGWWRAGGIDEPWRLEDILGCNQAATLIWEPPTTKETQ